MITPLFSQKNTYKVVNTNNVENISAYRTAMDKANFDAYRYIRSEEHTSELQSH